MHCLIVRFARGFTGTTTITTCLTCAKWHFVRRPRKRPHRNRFTPGSGTSATGSSGRSLSMQGLCAYLGARTPYITSSLPLLLSFLFFPLKSQLRPTSSSSHPFSRHLKIASRSWEIFPSRSRNLFTHSTCPEYSSAFRSCSFLVAAHLGLPSPIRSKGP